ncbi:hypothetical protein, partial [uncultured Leifsonia sp.]|uniref:hypothetical protein n=1 Tax=uncultured Leifsonia sp. TaxID=340359 RepID=UPI0028D635F9
AGPARVADVPDTGMGLLELDGTFAGLFVLAGDARVRSHEERGTSPIGAVTTVAWAEFDGVGVDEVIAVAVHLGRIVPAGAPTVEIVRGSGGGATALVRWADGPVTSVAV